MKLQALLLIIPVILTWYSTGFYALRLIGFPCKSKSDVLIAVMFGFGVIGNAFTLLAFCQRLSPLYIIVVLALFFIGGFFKAFNVLPQLLQCKVTRLTNPYLIGIIAFMTIYAIRSLLPPVGIDALMYHLPVPKLFLEHGGFYPIPWIRHSDLPMLGEMNFLIGIVFNNPVLCRQTSFFTGIFLCGIILLIGYATVEDKRHVPFILLLLLSHTTITANMSMCDVDILTASFTLASFYLLKKASDENRSLKGFLPAIFFICFTVESKPFGIFIIPLACIFLIITMRKSGTIRWNILAAALLLPAAAGSIWYLKSIYFSGIPVSGITTWKAAADEATTNHTGFYTVLFNRFLFALHNIIAAPWSYSLFPLKHRMDCFGPLFLGCIPFSLFIRKNNWFIQIVLWASGIWLMFILLSTSRGFHGNLSIRYMTAPVAFFTILTIYTFSTLKPSPLKKIIHISLWTWILISFVVSVKRYRHDIISVATCKPPHEYLMKHYDLYPVINYINTQLPKSCHIRPAYCFGAFYINKPYSCALHHFDNVDTMLTQYKSEGVTHLLANNTLQPESNNELWFKGEKLELLHSANHYYLYKIP